MRSILAAALPAYTIRGSEHDAIYEPRSIRVTVDNVDGVRPLPGNGDCKINVEVKTMLNLYANFTSAKTAHDALCGSVFDVLMDDGLMSSLTVSGLTIQGVMTGETQSQRNENGTITNTMSRVVRGVPQ